MRICRDVAGNSPTGLIFVLGKRFETSHANKTGELFDPFNPGQHMGIRRQVDLTVSGKGHIRKDSDVGNGRRADKPILAAEMLVKLVENKPGLFSRSLNVNGFDPKQMIETGRFWALAHFASGNGQPTND